jgi:hypothetical protein
MTTTRIARPARTTDQKVAAAYARQEVILRDEIAELNALLGLAEDAEYKVTFGYLGNLGNGRDDRTWMVFLPHPGRVGTADDQVGSFSTGNLEGIVATRRALKSVAQGVRLARLAVNA